MTRKPFVEARAIGRQRVAGLALPGLLAVTACTAEVADSSPAVDVGEDEATSQAVATSTLALGSEGPEVEEVYDYLKRYGYFPNPALTERYPGYEPIVDEAPADPSYYDRQMQAGVRAFQVKSGLEATGVANAKTRALMQQPRCPHPDGDLGSTADLDPDSRIQKYSLAPESGREKGFTWRAANGTPGLPRDEFRQYFQLAVINRWQKYYDWSITHVSSNEDTRVEFATIDGPRTDTNNDGSCDEGCKAARAHPYGDFIQFDDENWGFWSPVGSDQIDFVYSAMHEVGHIIGLNHTSSPDGLMYYLQKLGPRDYQFSADDRMAIRAGVGRWAFVDSGLPLVDITANHVGMGLTSDGRVCTIQRNGAADSCIQGVPGTPRRIAVDPRNRPWIINAANEVHVFVGGYWRHVPGSCGLDLAIIDEGGPNEDDDGTVIAVGCDRKAYASVMSSAASNAELEQNLDAGWWRLESPEQPALDSIAIGAVGGKFGFPAFATDLGGDTWTWLGHSTGWVSFSDFMDRDPQVGDLVASTDQAAVWGISADETEIVAFNYQGGNEPSTFQEAQWLNAYEGSDFDRVAAFDDGKPLVLDNHGTIWTTTK